MVQKLKNKCQIQLFVTAFALNQSGNLQLSPHSMLNMSNLAQMYSRNFGNKPSFIFLKRGHYCKYDADEKEEKFGTAIFMV